MLKTCEKAFCRAVSFFGHGSGWSIGEVRIQAGLRTAPRSEVLRRGHARGHRGRAFVLHDPSASVPIEGRPEEHRSGATGTQHLRTAQSFGQASFRAPRSAHEIVFPLGSEPPGQDGADDPGAWQGSARKSYQDTFDSGIRRPILHEREADGNVHSTEKHVAAKARGHEAKTRALPGQMIATQRFASANAGARQQKANQRTKVWSEPCLRLRPG